MAGSPWDETRGSLHSIPRDHDTHNVDKSKWDGDRGDPWAARFHVAPSGLPERVGPLGSMGSRPWLQHVAASRLLNEPCRPFGAGCAPGF